MTLTLLQMRYFEDKLSPLLISFFVILTLTILFVMRLIDFLSVQPY